SMETLAAACTPVPEAGAAVRRTSSSGSAETTAAEPTARPAPRSAESARSSRSTSRVATAPESTAGGAVTAATPKDGRRTALPIRAAAEAFARSAETEAGTIERVLLTGRVEAGAQASIHQERGLAVSGCFRKSGVG